MASADKALDAYLVAAIRTGDARAAGMLVRHRSPRLIAHARRLLGDADAAQDMVQEAWLEILRGLGGLRDGAAFLPWALRIVSRRVVREIARRQKHRRIADELAALPDEPIGDEAALSLDAGKVVEALKRLSPEQSATVALFYLDELSVAEVAEALDVPVGTVKTRLMHARAKLRAHLEGGENDTVG